MSDRQYIERIAANRPPQRKELLRLGYGAIRMGV
jgi:hypothetical protein